MSTTTTVPNVQWGVDQNVVKALDAAEADAREFLAKYVDAMKRANELRALMQLREAMGGEVVDAAEPTARGMSVVA